MSEKVDPMDVTLKWTAGDPVSFAFTAMDLDWSGSYQLQVRDTYLPAGTVARELDVTAVLVGANTVFTFTGPALPGEKPGLHVWDVQQVGGVTRLGGKARIRGQVTA
jgi:hypothetical protein